jgi:hypothetical protein
VSSLSGRCPNISFAVSGRDVDAGSSTAYGGGKCGDLRNGRSVDVTGMQQSDGAIAATSIHIGK